MGQTQKIKIHGKDSEKKKNKKEGKQEEVGLKLGTFW